MKMIRLISFNFCLLLLFANSIFAQDKSNLTADEFYNKAKLLPKDKSNYPKIIDLLKLALEKDQNYADVRLLLGRVYTWNGNLDSARLQFNQVIAKGKQIEEAYSAIFDVEYWNKNFSRALDHANQGLLYTPNSAELLVKKAKALSALNEQRQALALLKNYLKDNPQQDSVKNYYHLLRKENTTNIISLGYEYVYFDRRFDDLWHYTNLDYTRKTSFGPVTGRLIYSNRFKKEGLQGEIDAYPIISKKINAYVGMAFSNAAIFPKFRTGASLYYVFPKSFDAETGFRYLNFDSLQVALAVIGLGKYVKNWYFNLQSYVSVSTKVPANSVTLSARYYFADRFNFAGIQIGTGISPDDRVRNINQALLNYKSYKLGLSYARDIFTNTSLATNVLWYYEQFAPNTWGNQIGINFTLNKRF